MSILWHRLSIVISWLITVISISLAFYYYSESKELPELSYSIKPIRGIVVRAGRSSKINVHYGDRLIEKDITAAQVVLWNEGEQAIKKSDILKPITIFTEKSVPILEVSILKTTREVIHPTLNINESQAGRVAITWDILEQGDGFTLQIIYEGKPDINISVDGIVEGQRQISLIRAPEGTIYRREFNRPLRKAFELYAIFILIMGVLLIPVLASKMAGDMFPIWIRIPLILLFMCCIGIIFHHLLYGYVEPPFGF